VSGGGSTLRFVDGEAIRAALPWPVIIEALATALVAGGEAPLRAHHRIEVPDAPEASLLLMPAWRSGARLGVKLVTVFPGNARQGESSVAAVYALFDAMNGRPLALFDGEELTARRTAAASALAARYLARADARHLLMIGAGRLARALVPAHASVRPIERISLWNRSAARAVATAQALRSEGHAVDIVDDLPAAVAAADIVSCATLASEPVLRGAWLRPGTHVDLVGAFRSTMRESDDALVVRAQPLVVDNRVAALAEGGDIVQAIASGAIDEGAISADLTDLISGRHPGRTHEDQVSVFKSVGFALEDLAAADAAWRALETHA
jgi:alanine dehydrogenase